MAVGPGKNSNDFNACRKDHSEIEIRTGDVRLKSDIDAVGQMRQRLSHLKPSKPDASGKFETEEQYCVVQRSRSDVEKTLLQSVDPVQKLLHGRHGEQVETCSREHDRGKTVQ